MPHKHTRKQGSDYSSFNLAPNVVATPLSALSKPRPKGKGQSHTEKASKKRPQKTKDYGKDDTPRAFARLMQMQNGKRLRSGPDDGDRPSAKKRAKVIAAEPTTQQKKEEPSAAANEALRLQPGERLGDFSARVNQAMPVVGLARKGKVKVEGVKERRTRKEKKMHKMYAEWREQDARIKARQEELAEEVEDQEEDRLAEYGGQAAILPVATSSKKQRAIGEIGQMNDDPWAVLKHKRQAPRGLHDVVKAPPDLKVIPTEKFKVRNGAKVSVANVPASAGSLKKREELSEARREVIERYRAMMKANKQ